MAAGKISPQRTTGQRILPLPLATGLILILWLVYTGGVALNMTGFLRQPAFVILEIITALLGVGVLMAAGFQRQELFLRLGRLSKKGLLALLITAPLMLPVFLSGTWGGISWNDLLVYAPGTAIGQELFFRCALFPLFLRLLPGRLGLAIFLAALLHGLWHVGPISTGAPWYGSLSVMAVPFLASLAWNWQVKHDRTFIWVMIYHLLIDQAMSLFVWAS